VATGVELCALQVNGIQSKHTFLHFVYIGISSRLVTIFSNTNIQQ